MSTQPPTFPSSALPDNHQQPLPLLKCTAQPPLECTAEPRPPVPWCVSILQNKFAKPWFSKIFRGHLLLVWVSDSLAGIGSSWYMENVGLCIAYHMLDEYIYPCPMHHNLPSAHAPDVFHAPLSHLFHFVPFFLLRHTMSLISCSRLSLVSFLFPLCLQQTLTQKWFHCSTSSKEWS